MENNVRREDWETLKPTVCGWGVNDINYPVTKREVINGKSKAVWYCPYYECWRSMIRRCFELKFQQRRPTYVGCTICEEWKYLSNFIKWVDSQPNKDWENCEPDKDFLSNGNKHYSPETCCFIKRSFNSFIIDSAAARGPLMLGVCFNGGSNTKSPYKSRCKNPFTGAVEYLGAFATEYEAHKAWQNRKHIFANLLAEQLEDARVADALRQRYAPDKDWTKA